MNMIISSKNGKKISPWFTRKWGKNSCKKGRFKWGWRFSTMFIPKLVGGFKYLFYVHHYSVKWSNWTNIFQRSWNKPPTRIVEDVHFLIIVSCPMSLNIQWPLESLAFFEDQTTPCLYRFRAPSIKGSTAPSLWGQQGCQVQNGLAYRTHHLGLSTKPGRWNKRWWWKRW